ncbi:MAG: hypothetical protein JNL10_19400 [Verrucomicrobiales bacterium]|nr:hypothetical protein [Verrucomicrobiales bacterium]
MNTPTLLRTAAVAGLVLLSTGTLGAADAKSYQVTRPMLEVTDTTITVHKGDDPWQLARTKVTIYYQMVSTDVEVKTDKPTKKDK